MGATPVPGPIIIIGSSGAGGRKDDFVSLIITHTFSPTGLRERKVEHTPLCRRPVGVSPLTTPTVMETVDTWCSGDEEMEYKRGFNGGSSARASPTLRRIDLNLRRSSTSGICMRCIAAWLSACSCSRSKGSVTLVCTYAKHCALSGRERSNAFVRRSRRSTGR